MPAKDLTCENGPKSGHDQKGRFTDGNPGGQKGRSGRYPAAIALRCESLIVTEVLPVIERYLQRVGKTKRACADRGYQWCAQYVANLLPKEIQHSGEVDVNVQDARRTFESRMDRLTQRLGTATMPEWPER